MKIDRIVSRLLAACGLLAALSGCASTWVDGQGRKHIVGLVWMTLPASKADPASVAAEVVRTRSLGVTLNASPQGGSLAVGYTDQTQGTIFDNKTVAFPIRPVEKP